VPVMVGRGTVVPGGGIELMNAASWLCTAARDELDRTSLAAVVNDACLLAP